MLNEFRYEGVICDKPKPLYKGDDPAKGLNGHTALIGQMGKGINFYIPAADIPNPNEGDRVIIVGRLEPNDRQWGKPKVERVYHADDVAVQGWESFKAEAEPQEAA